MSKNVPITFTWRSLVQDHEWPEKSTVKKIPSGVQIMAVAFVLERHADADGTNVFPSVGTIADLARVSPATVRKVLKVMRDQKFLRPDGRGRHKTLKYRLVYPSLSSQIDPAESISVSKSRQTTNRTESPSAHSSPDGALVAPSANTERSVSLPKVKDDLVDVERKKDEPASANSNLGKMTARGKSVVTKSQAQIDAEKIRIEKQVDEILKRWVEDSNAQSDNFYPSWEHKEKEIVEVFDLIYNDFDMFSLICKVIQYFDRKEWKWVAFEMTLSRWLTDERRYSIESFLNRTASQAVVALIDAVKRHDLSETLVAKVSPQDLEVHDLHALTISEIRSRFYRIKESIVIDIRDEQRRIHLQRISVSATNTGSDPSIVEKIVETVSEKVDERW